MLTDIIGREIIIDYTNWKGERGFRRIIPNRLDWGANDWHTEPQWLLLAWDCEKGAIRTFALSGVHGVVPAN